MERKKATVYPPQTEVYSWTRYCEIQQVKVIILGQVFLNISLFRFILIGLNFVLGSLPWSKAGPRYIFCLNFKKTQQLLLLSGISFSVCKGVPKPPRFVSLSNESLLQLFLFKQFGEHFQRDKNRIPRIRHSKSRRTHWMG